MKSSLTSAFLGLAFALVANAQSPVGPAGGPSATVVGDGKTAVSSSVNIVLYSPVDSTLVFQSYGLHGPVDVGPASLTTPSLVKLNAGEYITVPIVITGLAKFGTYKGKVEFRKATVEPGKGTVVPLTITVVGAITLQPPALSGFRCIVPWSCALGKFLAPVSRTILVDNENARVPVQIINVTMMLRLATSDSTLTERDLMLDPVATIPASRNAVLPVTVPAGKVAPGKYEGFVYLGFQSGDFVSAPVTLTVRDAPLLPIVLLALGIVFGRVLQAVNSPNAQAQQRLLTSLAALRSATVAIDDANVSLLLEKKMADARQAIATMTDGETAIMQQLQGIGSAITIEANLQWITNNLNRIPSSDRQVVQSDVESSRLFLLGDDLSNADIARKKAQAELLNKLTLAEILPGELTAKNMDFSAVPPSLPRRAVHARVAMFLAGAPAHLPRGKYAFLKDIMFIFLLAGLIVLGLYNLYINNPVFGASRLFDYFGIAVWGLSADIAQRTLQGLQLPR